MANKRPQDAKGGEAFTLDDVTRLVESLEGTDVRSLVWARGAEKVVIRRGQAPVPVTQVVAPPVPVPVALAAPAAPTAASAAATAPAAPAAPQAAAPATARAADKPGHLITSPLVGTFYRAPSPDSPPFVEVGSTVKKGQVLCIVEAMKIMNEIESDGDGKVAEIYVLNATPVEFGEKLFRLEPL
ncbi:MAG TPA: acetyl-CoA carboxylase biotin carboxyl carrier protein [Anaeromyxobacteraceae bacterium]|nr:acetyl-CoA carboxylase biotin carboxyl carrier protein [Anaeromyxobacteraceae bacterium]